MPSLLTEVEAGQRAMLNMDLNPLRAQAEAERIPLETQKMQQSLAAEKINQETAALKMQALLETQADDRDSKQIIGELVKDPSFTTLSLADQQQRIGAALTSRGKFAIGEKFLKDAQQSKMTDANIKKTGHEIEQFNLERINTYLSGINTTGTPDEQSASLDTVLMGVKADGLMTPQQQQTFENNARAAYASGNLPQWKREAQATYDSIASKKQKEVVARNVAEEIRKELKTDEDRKQRRYEEDRKEARARTAEESRDERQERRLEAKDARLTSEQSFKEYNEIATRIIPRLNEQIRRARKDASEAPKDTRKSFEDEVATLEEERRDEYKKANSLRAQLKLPPLPTPKDGPPVSGSGAAETKPKVVRPTPIRPADVPNDWVLRQDAEGNRAWVSPNGEDFKEIKRPKVGATDSF